MKHSKIVIIAGVISVFALVLPVLASNAEDNVNLPTDKVISGNYYTVGQTVEINGRVESDLVVAGGNVLVSGEVGGDVLALGGNVRIIGPVSGNVRILGGNVEIAGPVGHNVMIGAGKLIILPSSQIQGHITAGAGTLEVNGLVEGDVLVGASNVKITGNVKGAVDVWLEHNGILNISKTAVLESQLVYHGNTQAQIEQGAKLAQAPVFKEWNKNAVEHGWWWGWLISLFGALVLGMVLMSLWSRQIMETGQEILTHTWPSLGWGAIWGVAVPIICIILLFTLIGIPLALVVVGLYFISCLVAQVIAGAAIGLLLKSKIKGVMDKWSNLVIVLIGIFMYRLLAGLPWVGGLVILAGTLLAWGAVLRVQRKNLVIFK
jgi:cytoskeletal protein CcmA (bactofilin family)